MQENSDCVLYTVKYYSNEKDVFCELFKDKASTKLVDFKNSLKNKNILYQIFGIPFNLTSGYCHKPNITNLQAFDDRDTIVTWAGREKGKKFNA